MLDFDFFKKTILMRTKLRLWNVGGGILVSHENRILISNSLRNHNLIFHFQIIIDPSIWFTFPLFIFKKNKLLILLPLTPFPQLISKHNIGEFFFYVVFDSDSWYMHIFAKLPWPAWSFNETMTSSRDYPTYLTTMGRHDKLSGGAQA